MKIGLAQIKSLKGDVANNIEHHLLMVKHAINLGVDLVVFPELSITNYEPELAKGLATTANDDMFSPFQQLANEHKVVIGIGMPTCYREGTRISMILFSSGKNRIVYSKQLLHSDELPYFVKGDEQTILTINGVNIALGICYETLQEEHFKQCNRLGADIYIASVAKPERGLQKAYDHFPKMSIAYNTPVLMVNAIGASDNFISAGQSCAWGSDGEILSQLNNCDEGIIVYDTDTLTFEFIIQ